jgi:predicted Co/Zn/Cd cation transporter (cation efflux family)
MTAAEFSPARLPMAQAALGCRLHAARAIRTNGRTSMKAVCIVLGAALIAVAVIYFMVPADSLPGFFPGHEADVHVKHGIVAGAAGLVLMALAWFMGRR